MIRVSREQLAERWALTYAQDGYQVRAGNVSGLEAPQSTAGNVVPDLEASKDDEQILVHIIASPEDYEDAQLRQDLVSLEKARAAGKQLHLIVVAECAHDIKERLDAWGVKADRVHVT